MSLETNHYYDEGATSGSNPESHTGQELEPTGVRLNTHGIGVLEDGTEVVGISSYHKFIRLRRRITALEAWLKEANIQPIHGVEGLRGSRRVSVFLRVEVDAVIKANETCSTVVEMDAKTGIGTLPDGREVIGINAYAIFRKSAPETLEEWLEEANIQPVNDVKGLNSSRRFDVFLKAKVDAVIEENEACSTVVEMDAKTGIGTLPDGREVIGIKAYAGFRRLGYQTLGGWLEEAGIQPVDSVQGLNSSRRFDVFLKTEVDAVIEKNEACSTVVEIDATTGIGILPNRREVIGIKAYAGFRRLSDQTPWRMARRSRHTTCG